MDFDFLVESITPTQTTNLIVNATGAIGLPVGTTAQRPGSFPSGYFRYNSDNLNVEFANGSSWVALGTGTGTLTSITFTGSTGLAVSGSPATGSTGAITYTLGAELQGLSALSANGMLARTAAGTYTSRTIAGTASDITVTDGDGVAGAPTIDLATVTQGSTGTSFVKVQLDTKGRVINNTAVVTGDITALVNGTYVALAGSSMASAANITFSGGGTVTGLPTPVNSSDAAPKSYVDALQAGLEWKNETAAASTAALTVTYSNGTAGVGATLTNAGTQAAFTIDGYTASVNDRILIKNQATQFQNGVYVVTSVGSGASNWVLTRATDANAPGSLNNATMYVTNGTVNSNTGWTQTTANPTIGTSNIVFVQFSGTGTYTSGTGITLTGNVFSLTAPVTPALGGTGTTTAPSAVGQLLIATSGNIYAPATLTQGTAITITNGSGSITIANAGVTSAVAGTGIGVSGATGAVTITNNGVTGITGTTNQVTASASTGSVTLSIPSTFIAPGTVAVTGATFLSYATVSAAGSSQGTATALTIDVNAVTTVGSGQGVVLPTAASPFGRTLTVFNRGANALLVYPASGASIDGGAANAAVSVPVGGVLTVASSTATQWYTIDAVPVAGAGISVTAGNGIITYANTGVTSAVAGAGISVSGATGAVTITNTGVTSVGFTDASTSPIYTVTNSPVTTTGTLTITLQTQTTNKVFASPNGSTGQPSFRALVQADLSFLQLYKENASTPTAPVAAGANAVAIGSGSSAPSINSVAIGDGTSPSIWGGKALGNGKFATAGDAQAGVYVSRAITTNATVTEIFLDGAGASQRLVLPNNSAFTFDITIVARRTDATGGTAAYRHQGVMKRDATAATTALIGSVSKTVMAETNSAWDSLVTADTTNGSIMIQVTGEAAKTIRWVATIRTTEVTN